MLCVCECVCAYRAASRATAQCKYGKHAGHLQKRLLRRLVRTSRQYTAVRFASMSIYKQARLLLCLGPLERVCSRLWTQSGDRRSYVQGCVCVLVCSSAFRATSHRARSQWNMHTHFRVSFSQRGTLAFAACLSNLTRKGLGHLSRACIWDHTIPARVRLSRPRRESLK